MVSKIDEEKFIKLRAQGYSFDKIAVRLGISKKTLIRLQKKYSNEIRELATESMKAVIDTFRLSIEKRIARLGGDMDKLDGLLEGRNVADLPTAEILRIRLKTMNMVDKLLANNPSGDDDPWLRIWKYCWTPKLADFSTDEILAEVDRRIAEQEGGIQ